MNLELREAGITITSMQDLVPYGGAVQQGRHAQSHQQQTSRRNSNISPVRVTTVVRGAVSVAAACIPRRAFFQRRMIMATPTMIVSKLNGNVIDIQGNSTGASALLDAFPSKATVAGRDS
jgi:hypothetical protein